MKNRERDPQMDALLRMALAGEHRPPASVCLDAEVLAAWADGGLAAPERAAAEAHAAGCAQCQAMMASMVRSLPAEAALDAARSPLRRWMMFLAPAMAGAVAVALWINVGRSRDPRPTAMTSSPVTTTADRSVAAPAEAPAAAPAKTKKEQPPAAPSAAASPAAKPDTRPADELRKQPTPEVVQEKVMVAAERDRATTIVMGGTPKPAEAKARKDAPATAAPPVAAPPLPRSVDAPGLVPPPQIANQANQANQAANQQADQQLQQAQGMLDARTAAGRGGRDVTQLAAARAAQSFFSAQVIVAPPSGLTRWRLTGGSTIEHSADSGQTWATQYDAGAGVSIVAGTAVSATVAWMVGRNGVVLVTADGRTWTRTAVPGTPDLTAVAAADALTATVLTADGRRFTTADGGRTWK